MHRYFVSVGDSRVLVTDTITILEPGDAGAIAVSGSHGGVSSAQFVMGRGLGAVVYNDAGVGKDDAGISSLAILEELQLPAMTVASGSARIGDGADTWEHGVVSAVNRTAQRAGAVAGQVLQVAVALLVDAGMAARGPEDEPGTPVLTRAQRQVGSSSVVLLDSISMIGATDAGRLVVSGSHGGAVSGEFAARAKPRLAVFNDAGVGKDDAGIASLALLQAAAVAGVTVASDSARIGDPADALEHGVISHANAAAAAQGFAPGSRLIEALRVASAA